VPDLLTLIYQKVGNLKRQFNLRQSGKKAAKRQGKEHIEGF